MFFVLFCAGCSEDNNYKEYFPRRNGEKPADFVYTFRKDYKHTKNDSFEYFERVRSFAKKYSMYKGGQGINSSGSKIEYYVAGPPMKYLLQAVELDDSIFRVRISNYPGRECTLCNAFINEVDPILSGIHE